VFEEDAVDGEVENLHLGSGQLVFDRHALAGVAAGTCDEVPDETEENNNITVRNLPVELNSA
jgi:hypothetical protein